MRANSIVAKLAGQSAKLFPADFHTRTEDRLVEKIESLRRTLSAATRLDDIKKLSSQLGVLEREYQRIVEDAGQSNLLTDLL